ncbi:uncharacterized protein LOC120109585 [Phoenix dactylifera]|uniref:Uncharacterized protein LOC103715794 n=1 Tax=Phoenix dactylifera TaxID=42345 RepID=A0A8B9A7X2_PHODC|nr:uncharacterized protein LOC103715794 [Phoenix dactylifera]XP_038979274.1 uncharacterized protein LOC120109585 [Phoenix dactylifera]
MDPIHGDSRSKHTYDEQRHPGLGNKPEIKKVTPSSSSDGESFEEGFFQLDAAELDKSFLQITEIASDKLASQSKTQNGKVNDTNDVGMSDNLDMFGRNHSPPLQVMGRSDVPDPNIVPSSMFTRTTSSAIDGSVVSNESLFSIQMGNSSFSRDHVFLTGRSRDLTNFPMDPPSAAEAANAAAMQGVLRVNAEKVGGKDKHPAGDMHHSASISNLFDSRMASFQSFTFAELTDGRSGSVKVGPVNQPRHWEQAQQRPPQTKTTKATPAAKCFPCFSCSFCS